MRCQLQSEIGWRETGFVFLSKGTYTPVYVWDEPICMHACLPAYLLVWTEPDRIGPLLISYLASNQLTCSVVDNDGHTAVPMCPALPQRPPAHPWPLLRGTDPPLSVRCSQDQQPRQCPFHHSGPQCSFHKLSQALGLKERTAMGFGLCKHTDACGWQVGAQNTMFTPPRQHTPLLSSLHPSLNPRRGYIHQRKSVVRNHRINTRSQSAGGGVQGSWGFSSWASSRQSMQRCS